MSKQPYLSVKNGAYYFRIVTPKSLRRQIHKNELIYSLRTKCKYEAKIRCMSILKASQLLFKKFETMPRLTPDEAKAIVKDYFSKAIRCLEHQMDVVDEYSGFLAGFAPRSTALDLTGDRERLDFLYPYVFYDNNQEPALGLNNNYKPDLEAIIGYLKQTHKIDAPENTYSYEVLKKAAERAVTELLSVHKQYVGYESDITIADDLFKAAPVASPVIQCDAGQKISELFHKYLAECDRNGESKGSVAAKRRCYDLWIDIFDDHSINLLSAEYAVKFKDAVFKIPANKTKIYADKSVKELLSMNIPNDQKLSINTSNAYLVQIRIFTQWAIDNHYLKLEKNPFDRMKVKQRAKAKMKDARMPLSMVQLNGIFSTTIYTGCESDTQQGRYKKGQLIIKDHLYWIPILALYTGARMSEILQLKVADIQTDGGIVFLDINDSGDKNIKTTQSKRRIPIHDDVMNFGFTDYVESMHSQGHDRVFHQIEPYNGDYSHRYSKWFSRYLERYNIKTDKTSFHSFRHNFRDALKGKVSETLLRALLGHEKGDAHNSYGSSHYELSDLKAALDNLDYSYIWQKT